MAKKSKGKGKGTKGVKGGSKAAKAAKKQEKASKKKAGLKEEMKSLQLQNHFQVRDDEVGVLTLKDGSKHQVGFVELIEDKLGVFVRAEYTADSEQDILLVPFDEVRALVRTIVEQPEKAEVAEESAFAGEAN